MYKKFDRGLFTGYTMKNITINGFKIKTNHIFGMCLEYILLILCSQDRINNILL